MSNNCLEYKGYHSRPEYLSDDDCFYGKIIGIDDLVDFYSDNVTDLKLEFQKAVDDYLEFCEEIGKLPQKEYSGSFNVRISPELHKQAALIAAKDNITLNQYVAQSIEKSIELSFEQKIPDQFVHEVTKEMMINSIQSESQNSHMRFWESSERTKTRQVEVSL